MLPFSFEDLQAAVDNGDVTARPHPTLPLKIYNYSPEVQFGKKWNEVTLNCRGLILDDQYRIVARPWRKFFNLGEVNLPIQFDTPVEVMDKADGSLGILYPDRPGTYSNSISTRGSFASEQAQRATLMWKARYTEYDKVAQISGMTYLFEIVYPQNRIVLDYGDMEDLILLGAVQKSTGYYYGPQAAQSFLDWEGPVVETMPFNTISDALALTDRKNAEGYVIRSHNFMVKVKQPDYLELHRLVTNASPRTVWEQLKAGKSKTEIVSAFPDEFHDYVSGMADPLLDAYEKRDAEIRDGFESVLDSFMSDGVEFNRAGFARSIAKAKDKRYYFLMLDGKSIREVLWGELKPTMKE